MVHMQLVNIVFQYGHHSKESQVKRFKHQYQQQLKPRTH